jgi:hypothetical protein
MRGPWMFVGGVVVGDGKERLAGWHGGLDGAEERMNSWWRCCCMQRPITLPSSTLRAANSADLRQRRPSVNHIS